MKHLTIAGTAAVILVATVSCSGSGGSGASGPSAGPASYLAVSNSKVAFIQWRATSNGHLRGTITDRHVGAGAPGETMSVSSAPFVGTITHNSVRLTFASLFFLHTGAHGTLSGSRLTLRVPQSDGAIQPVTFSQSDVTSYHSAIATLRRSIQHANLKAAHQDAARPQQPAKVQTEQGARKSLTTLNNDSSLALGGMLAGSVARNAADTRKARSNLATEKHDAAGDKRYCGAAFAVSGDAQKVDGALEVVQGDVRSMMAAISIVRFDIATAKAHLRDLGKAGLPAPSSASNVIGSARANLTHAIATANSYIDQVNAIDAQAHSIANKMATGPCSGAKSGSSARPISHIR